MRMHAHSCQTDGGLDPHVAFWFTFRAIWDSPGVALRMLQRTDPTPLAPRQVSLAPQTVPIAPIAPWPSAMILVGVVLLDMVLLALAGTLTHAVLVGGLPQGPYRTTIALAMVLGLAVKVAAGAYAPRFFFSFGRQAQRAMAGFLAGIAAVYAVEWAFDIAASMRLAWLAAFPVAGAVSLALGRATLVTLVKRDPQRRFAQRTVVVGGGAHGSRLVMALRRNSDASIRLLGFVDDRYTRIDPAMEAVPFLGPVEDLFAMIRAGQVDQVIVALPWSAEERMLSLVDRMSEFPVHVRLAPDLISYHFPEAESSAVGGLQVAHLMDRPISGWSSVVKRIEDVVIAGTALAILALPMALIALLVRLDSAGPILFRQKRTGFNNRNFEMLKFRTMVHGHVEPAGGVRQATQDDPRVTRVGRWLRRLSLDELPQLLNVIRGDMSVVGPRPHAPGTRAGGRRFEEVVNRYASRHRVKPGMTGLAQVRGWRGETETEEKLVRRVESDLEYIDRWSVWLDVSILVRTLLMVLRMRNAY